MITAQSGSWRFKALVVAVATAIAFTNVSEANAATTWGKWALGEKSTFNDWFKGETQISLNPKGRTVEAWTKSDLIESSGAHAFLISTSAPFTPVKQFVATRMCWYSPQNIQYQLSTDGSGFSAPVGPITPWVGFEWSKVHVGFNVIEVRAGKETVLATGVGDTRKPSSVGSLIAEQSNTFVSTGFTVKKGTTKWLEAPKKGVCEHLFNPNNWLLSTKVTFKKGSKYQLRMTLVASAMTTGGGATTRIRWREDSPSTRFYFTGSSGDEFVP